MMEGMVATRTLKRLSWPEFVEMIGDRAAARRVADAYHGHGIPRPRKGDDERADRNRRICKRVEDLLRSGMLTKDAQRQAAREFGLQLRRVERITNGK